LGPGTTYAANAGTGADSSPKSATYFRIWNIWSSSRLVA
jgi:hypothetical protein